MIKVCGLVATVTLVAGASVVHGQTTLRYSDYGPNRGSRAAALEWFASELASRTEGDLTIEFFWGGSLLGGRDTLAGVGDGVADMGTVIGFFTPRELQLYNIGDLPMDNSDIRVGLRSMFEFSNRKALFEEFSSANVEYLTNFTTGPVQLICREEVTSLAELDGLKIRASGPYGDSLERLGAEIVSMSQSDVYQALDSGLIDCNQNYYYSMEAYRQYEVAPHVLALDWGQNMSFGIVMNQDRYESLSDDNRTILDELSSDFVDHLADVMIEAETSARKAMEAGIDGSSITVTDLSEEDRATLQKASAPSIEEWAARVEEAGGDSESLLETYRRLIDEAGAE